MQTVIDRVNPPHTKPVPDIDLQQAKKYTLDNGIEVYAIAAGFQDLIKVEFLYMNKLFNPMQPLRDSTTNRMLQEGTKNYSAAQLADLIDYYGAFLETDENFDFCSINLYTLNKYLGQTLPFIAELTYEPVFPEYELEVYKRNFKQRLTVENEKVASLARRNFSRIIFGENHSYGYFTELKDYDNLKREDLINYHIQKYDPSNCVIIISGMVSDSAIDLLNKHFGKKTPLHVNGQVNTAVPFVPDAVKKHYYEKEGAIQSAIRIGMPFFNRVHPDYPGMAVVNTLLGGYFGSRLMSNIREEKGYTYGIGSTIVSMKQEGYFFISTEVGSDVTNKALDEIYYEVEQIRNEPVDAEELEMVRNYMLGTFLKSIDGAFQLAERFKSIYLSGLDYSYYRRYLDKVRSIGPDEIQALARTYLNTADFYEVVVGRK
jgi:zinc protease